MLSILKRNDLEIISYLTCILFLYMIHMYLLMCLDMCIMIMNVHGYVYVFSSFIYHLGLKMTLSFFLSSILRFNKSYWLYLKYLHVWGFCIIIKLSCYMVSWLRFASWYIYLYMYIWYKRPLCVTIWFSFFGEIRIFHDYPNFHSFCFSFHLEVT